MGKGSLKERAKNRVDDLQGMFADLQTARKESRTMDVSVLEQQVHSLLNDWKSELDQPSPASSLHQAGSLGSFSSEIYRLLHLGEEEDDASSALPASKPEHDSHKVAVNDTSFFEGFNVNQEPHRQEFQFTDFSKGSHSTGQNVDTNSLLYPSESEFHHSYDLHQEVEQNQNFSGLFSPLVFGEEVSDQGFNVNQELHRQEFQFTDFSKGPHSTGQNVDTNSLLYPSESEFGHSYDLHQEVEQSYSGLFGPLVYGEEASDKVFGYLPNMCPPPSAFLGPKCSLWDCTRPAQESVHYCSSDHAALALKEGPPGMSPVLRPGGIGVKECLLFAVLNAKAESKDVGIPECEGAATAKSPWNAPELFDITVLEGETIREWLFFDKPRRAFENGNRKQRSLPDYNGRGWHESRKQVMNDYGGQKRSYYMDPQPRKDFEWHLYEYEIFNFHDCALYRLEFKRASDKKSPKGKSVPNDSVADLQKQMGRLTADSPTSKTK